MKFEDGNLYCDCGNIVDIEDTIEENVDLVNAECCKTVVGTCPACGEEICEVIEAKLVEMKIYNYKESEEE